jgi:hypothetical protein
MPDVLQLPRDIVELARIVAAEYLTHEQHTVAKVAAGLRERADTVDRTDLVVAALLAGCHTLGGSVVASPEVVARIALRAVADLLDQESGHSRTVPEHPDHPRTEATP